MNAKLLLGMLIAVAVFFGATALLQNNRNEAALQREGVLLPKLQKSVNDVRRMTLDVGGESMVFERGKEGAWTVPDRHHYPADRKKLDGLVLALARAERLEAKTKMPSRYDNLGLDPQAATSPPARVELFDGSEQSLAALWIGKRRPATTQESYFVREESDPTCWLVSGNLRIDPKRTQWLDATLTDVPSQDVQGVRIVHPDGDEIVLAKDADAASSAPLQILNLPEGKEPQSEYVTSRFAAALQALKLEDVLPADQVPMPDDEVVTSEFWTKDGLHVTVRTMEQDGKVYAQLDADTDPAGAPRTYEGPQDPEALPNVLDQGALDGSEGSRAAVDEAAQAAAQEIAGSIEQRAEGWVYVLPSWKASALRGRMDELLKKEDLPDPMGDMGPNPNGDTTLLDSVDVAPLNPEELPAASQPEVVTPANEPELGTTPTKTPTATPPPNSEDPQPAGTDAPTDKPKPPVFEIDPDAVKETGKGDTPAPAPSKKDNGPEGDSA